MSRNQASKLATWLGLIVTVGTILAATAKAVKAGTDATYVQRDTFNLYRADQVWKDTAIAQLWRACQHRGECP